jgi:hypothetical protein
MEGVGKHKRKLQASGGGEVELEREYAKCPVCGAGFFPLDEELELLPGSLTPHSHESLVRLGAWMPFEKAASLLTGLLGVTVSRSKSRRCTQAAGRAYVELQTEEADRIEREAPAPKRGCEQLVFSADGAMVPLLQGEWAKVKTLALGEVVPEPHQVGEGQVQIKKISYFSRLVEARRFEHLTLSEVHRRGVGQCKRVAAVLDGAEWLQSLLDYHCPRALRILDFAHAGQRLGEIAQSIWGAGSPKASQWTKKRLHQLKHQGPAGLLRQLDLLLQHAPQNETLAQNRAYLETRQTQMQYPHYQSQHWPIGSGMVESANKLVVEARLQGAGMHWKRENVDPMLALRNIICSDRWEQEWPRITRRLRQQAAQRKKSRRHRHLQENPASPTPRPAPGILKALNPKTSSKPAQASGPPKSPQTRKPPANHPWRRSPIGRARYQPSTFSKK